MQEMTICYKRPPVVTTQAGKRPHVIEKQWRELRSMKSAQTSTLMVTSGTNDQCGQLTTT